MPDHELAMEESLGDIVSPGDVVAGKYRVERVIGTGGMGVVVEAWHIHFEERVAIKFLFPQMGANEEALGRFEREARAAFKIKSEHVARVIDVGKLEGKAPYMVMEYLEGGDLADRLTDREPFVIEEAVDYVLQAIEAVAEAHVLGIVHRDLKPENLFIARQPDDSVCIKVLDFGLSKIDDPQGLEPRQRALTRNQQVMGTPQYMSPEQWMGAKHVGPASDQWALGIILYELLTGHQPFNQEHIAQLCTQVLRGDPPPIHALRPDVPSELVRVVDRCLCKQPEDRYRNVAELAVALYPFGSAAARASARRIAGVFKRIGDDPGHVPDSNQGGLGHGMVLRAGSVAGEGAGSSPGMAPDAASQAHSAMEQPPRPQGPPRPSLPRPAGPRPPGAASRPGRLRPERPSVPNNDEATLVQAFPEDESPETEGADDAAPTAVYEQTVAMPDEMKAAFEAMLRDEDTATGELPVPPTAPMTGPGAFAARPFGSESTTPGADVAPHAPSGPETSERSSNVAAATLVSAVDVPVPTPPAATPVGAAPTGAGGAIAGGAPARPRRAVTAQSWQHMLDETPHDGRKKVLAVFAAIVLSVVLALFLLVSPNDPVSEGQEGVGEAAPASAGEDGLQDDETEEEAEEEPAASAADGEGEAVEDPDPVVDEPAGEASAEEGSDGDAPGEPPPEPTASAKKKLPVRPVPRKHKGGSPSIFDHR